jgi:hypothetical protein
MATMVLHFMQVRESAETNSETAIRLPQDPQVMMMSAMAQYYHSFFHLRKSMLLEIMRGSLQVGCVNSGGPEESRVRETCVKTLTTDKYGKKA